MSQDCYCLEREKERERERGGRTDCGCCITYTDGRTDGQSDQMATFQGKGTTLATGCRCSYPLEGSQIPGSTANATKTETIEMAGGLPPFMELIWKLGDYRAADRVVGVRHTAAKSGCHPILPASKSRLLPPSVRPTQFDKKLFELGSRSRREGSNACSYYYTDFPLMYARSTASATTSR